jgi:hypothetical protein
LNISSVSDRREPVRITPSQLRRGGEGEERMRRGEEK